MTTQLGVPVSLPAEYSMYPSDTMFSVSSNELNTLGDDLLHWARTDDSALRNIDTTLLDDIYGDLASSGAFPNAFMNGY